MTQELSGKTPTIGAEFAGSERLGLAPKVLQNLWGSVRGFFSKLLKLCNPSAEPPAEGGAWICRSRTGFFSSQTRQAQSTRTAKLDHTSQGPRNGGFSNGGGLPDLDSSVPICPFLSFLGLSRNFGDFPDLSGDCPEIFPICPFPLSRPINVTYEEQSRKCP